MSLYKKLLLMPFVTTLVVLDTKWCCFPSYLLVRNKLLSYRDNPLMDCRECVVSSRPFDSASVGSRLDGLLKGIRR